MKLDDEDRLFQEAAAPMFARLSQFIGTGRPYTRVTIAVLEQILYDEGVKARLRHRGFPRLVLIVLPQRGWCTVVRRDLEHAGIQSTIRTMVDRFPGIGPAEIVPAVRAAFPEYNPENEGAKQMERALDRMLV